MKILSKKIMIGLVAGLIIVAFSAIIFARGIESTARDSGIGVKIDDCRCDLPGVQGPCETAETGFYWDGNSCEEFLWGGCEGLRPFVTYNECMYACR